MQSGLNWEIGLPGRNGQAKSFKLVEAGTYPLTKTDDGWVVDAESVLRTAENTNREPTPVTDVNDEAAEPAVAPVPTIATEEPNQPLPAPDMKSILELNKK